MPLPNFTSGRPKRQSSDEMRQVASEGEFHAAAEAVAVHGGNCRLRGIPEAHDDGEVPLKCAANGCGLGFSLAESHVEIESGRECAPGAGKHDGPDCVVTLSHVERGAELVHHRNVYRIELVGPIERQHGDGAVTLYKYERIGHAQPSFSRNQADFDCV